MAIRNIRKDEDPILRKETRQVEKFDSRLHTLLEDMAETMYDAPGVGLAAPQVGMLKKVVVYDSGNGICELINPEITLTEGEQIEIEGCLSVPGVYGTVKRPARIKYSYMDRNGKHHEGKAEEMEAVIISHETDHLHGILFTDKVIEYLSLEELEAMEESGDLDEETL
jgi:peptide deformylase